MGLPGFFRPAKPRQFHYEPLYYDERKEKMQERIRQAEQKSGIHSEDRYIKSITRGSFSRRRIGARKTKRFSAIRLIIILIFMLLISYWLLFF